MTKLINIYKENKDLFEKNLNLLGQFLKYLNVTLDVKNVIKCLEKIVELDPHADALQSYNLFNNYLNDWSQRFFKKFKKNK